MTMKNPKRSLRLYDTVNVAGTRTAAVSCGLTLEKSNDIGDGVTEVALFGTVKQHEQFMKAEGYTDSDWRPDTLGSQGIYQPR